MKNLIRLFTGFLAVFGIVAGQMPVMAQGGSGLQVSPTKTELVVEPGTTEKFSIQLTNVTGGAVKAVPTVFDFIPNDDGTPQIVTEDREETKAVSIKSFMPNIGSNRLETGQKITLDVSVSVPKDQAAGSYYGVIIFNANPADSDANSNESSGGKVALSAGVGHIVLIQVPGNITEKMQLVSATAGRKDKEGKVATGSIFSVAPTQMTFTVRNTGNSILRPFGNILIEKGGKQLANVQINNNDVKATVLPNSNRIFTEEIKDLKGFGRFTATINVSYGNGGDILTQKLNIWVVPVWLGVAIGVGVLALAGAVLFMVRKFKK